MCAKKPPPAEPARMRNNPWLSRREKQVFDLFYVENLTSYDVAAELDISRRTVFNDLASIKSKTM